ncbi:PilW family protein [Modicisalibacter luteus]|uniref:PilW family protein n=1 Tax=Modicisalibacter luteus TaxID=453962 RepID=A0ABV7LWZ7_9GAMM|nr:type II secretion system protein [Halomonas lutea]GHB11751.1 hypothetical protein GCM10007159_37510 [Halomonas lutea]
MIVPEQGCVRQRGFTLVELMIAMVIGLIIVLGSSQIFSANRQSFDRVEQLNDRQEKLRFLVDAVSLDVRTADSSMEILNAGSKLTLHYSGNRTSDPYCSGGVLEKLDYVFNVETSTLSLTSYCIGVSPVEEPLISDLDLVRFSEGVINGILTFVDVTVHFPAFDSEASAGREVTFRAANRSAVIARINADN